MPAGETHDAIEATFRIERARLIQASRQRARTGPDGAIIPLTAQDRAIC